MRDFKKTLLALAITVLVTACTTVGNKKVRDYSQQDIAQAVKKDVTTKSQVSAMLGKPTYIGKSESGRETWEYSHMRVTENMINFVPILNWFATSHDTNTREVVFEFNANDTVADYRQREVNETAGTGFLAKKSQ